MKKEASNARCRQKKAARRQAIPLINPERKSLTPEKLRELSGLHDLPEEQAEQIVRSIRLFVRILYESVKKKEPTCIDNQQVVNLKTTPPNTQKQVA